VAIIITEMRDRRDVGENQSLDKFFPHTEIPVIFEFNKAEGPRSFFVVI